MPLSRVRTARLRAGSRAKLPVRQRHLLRPCKAQKVRRDPPESLHLLPDSLQVRLVRGRKGVRIDQAAVPVDSGEPVPKLVCDARRELAETSERLLQPQLLFQLEHVRQVREQTDDAALAFGAGERRHRHAEVLWNRRHWSSAASAGRSAAVWPGIRQSRQRAAGPPRAACDSQRRRGPWRGRAVGGRPR